MSMTSAEYCNFLRKHTNMPISFHKISQLNNRLNSDFPFLLYSFQLLTVQVITQRNIMNQTKNVTCD